MSSSPPSRLRDRDALLQQDHHADFLTWRPASCLDCVRIMDAPSGGRGEEELESLMTRVGILHDDEYESSGERYTLDGGYNLIFLQPHHAREWEEIGTFSIVPELSRMGDLVQMLRGANADWKARWEKDKTARRVLDFRTPPFLSPLFTTLLHTNDTSFGLSLIWRHPTPPADAETFHAQSILTDLDLTRRRWIAVNPHDPQPTPFPYPPSTRPVATRINPLALVIHTQLRQERRREEPRYEPEMEPETVELLRRVEEAYGLIFWMPEGLGEVWEREEGERRRRREEKEKEEKEKAVQEEKEVVEEEVESTTLSEEVEGLERQESEGGASEEKDEDRMLRLFAPLGQGVRYYRRRESSESSELLGAESDSSLKASLPGAEPDKSASVSQWLAATSEKRAE